MKQYIMLSVLLLLSLMTWAQGGDKYKYIRAWVTICIVYFMIRESRHCRNEERRKESGCK